MSANKWHHRRLHRLPSRVPVVHRGNPSPGNPRPAPPTSPRKHRFPPRARRRPSPVRKVPLACPGRCGHQLLPGRWNLRRVHPKTAKLESRPNVRYVFTGTRGKGRSLFSSPMPTPRLTLLPAPRLMVGRKPCCCARRFNKGKPRAPSSPATNPSIAGMATLPRPESRPCLGKAIPIATPEIRPKCRPIMSGSSVAISPIK